MKITHAPLDLLASTPTFDGGGVLPPGLNKVEGGPEGTTVAPPRGPGTDANKPLSEMTDAERAVYFEKRADRYRDTLRAYGEIKPEDLATLQDKAAKHDALELELGSAADKAAAQAKSEALAAAVPAIVRAEFKAAAKGFLSAEQLSALLEDRDLSKYADSKGVPNEEKIAALVAQFAPAAPARPTGPSATGLGNRATAPSAPGEQGRAMAAKRFGAKTS